MNPTERFIEQKHILIRRLDNPAYEDKLTIEAEIERLDNLIFGNVQTQLKEQYETLKNQVQTIQKTVFDDGKFKRAIAKVLIEFLKTELDDKTIKGVARQMYKLMRGL